MSTDAILAALRRGPLSPGVLATRLGITRARVRARIKQLEDEGLVVTSGTTASRLVTLAAAAAKEGL